MKKVFKVLFHRVAVVAILMLIQLTLIIGFVLQFRVYFIYFYIASVTLSLIATIRVLNSRRNPAYQLAWIFTILLAPIFGVTLYAIFGRVRMSKSHRQKRTEVPGNAATALENVGITTADFSNISTKQLAINQTRYIANFTKMPLTRSVGCEYLPLGEVMFERMKKELLTAKKYIFMEYFIIHSGIMWDSILEILKQKAAEGVDVRLIYDDLGCSFTLPLKYHRTLEEMGIQCRVFNPFIPVLSSLFNNRSHRKTTIIDGEVAFTGGINMADEYINAIEKFGHWKDTGILVKGDAAYEFTVQFLTQWDYINGEERPYNFYRSNRVFAPTGGYIQAYSDTPLDEELVSETIYMNMINSAQHYLYICTPYLVIDNELRTAFSTAAKRGVDVRIITPHKWDKWYVHPVTQSNYEQLIESGVKIYEYTPGFMHAKSFVADDLYATIGTVNLDFRSLYLHFECGVWMYKTEAISQIKQDFLSTQEISEHITLEKARAVPWHRKIFRSLLRLFSPLM